MSLAAFLQTHDEDALSAIVSVGLVRRARRDADAGKAEVDTRSHDSASVLADGQQVTLLDSGLDAARCTCPATGICRHILLAVLTLRALRDTEEPASVTASAQDELGALSEDDLRKFAGADWDKAITLARISGQTTQSEEGANLSVTLPDIEQPVVFLAGQGLSGAVFKGAKSAKRRVVTAAAFLARQSAGIQPLDKLQKEAPDTEVISPAFLEQLRDAIEELVIAVFRGGSVIAEDRVFDLSISARAQAAPRVTALLRVLVRHARNARARDFSYHDDQFLGDAALAFALCRALETTPEDTDLTGQLRRTYRNVDKMALLVLGAVGWHGDSGARGLRVYGYDTLSQAWVTSVQARGAGMDPGFAPKQAYHQPLWGGASARLSVGTIVTLVQARAARDNQLAWDKGHVLRTDTGFASALLNAGIVFTSWHAARADIARRAEVGLRHLGAGVPVLLRPSDLSDVGFDDLRQRYVLTAHDRDRAQVELTLPRVPPETVDWMMRVKSEFSAILCEARLSDLRLTLEPVSLLFAPDSTAALDHAAFNLTLDRAPEPARDSALALGKRALQSLGARISRTPARRDQARPSAVHRLCNAVLDATVEVLRLGQSARLDDLAGQADALALATLRDALKALQTDASAANALRVGFVCATILSHDVLQG